MDSKLVDSKLAKLNDCKMADWLVNLECDYGQNWMTENPITSKSKLWKKFKSKVLIVWNLFI